MGDQSGCSPVRQGGFAVTIIPIKARRVYREIVDQLADLITRGEFAPGCQLPSELELVEQLGVSRASVREALVALEIMGLIETQRGQGRFVRSADRGAAFPGQAQTWLAGEESPFSLLQMRKLLEPGVAGLAARMRSEEALARIADALGLSEGGLEDTTLDSESDRMFHKAVAQATENSVVEAVAEFTCGLMGQKLWRALDYTGEGTLARLPFYRAQHKAVYESIRAKDEEGAAREMLAHLEAVENAMMA